MYILNCFQRLTAPICTVNGQHGQNTAPAVIHKQAYHSIAKCVAALTVVCPHEALPVVQQFLQELKVCCSFYIFFLVLNCGDCYKVFVVDIGFQYYHSGNYYQCFLKNKNEIILFSVYGSLYFLVCKLNKFLNSKLCSFIRVDDFN